jgi:hypothetical protein
MRFFDTGDSDTDGKLPLVSLTPAANFPPVPLTLVEQICHRYQRDQQYTSGKIYQWCR